MNSPRFHLMIIRVTQPVLDLGAVNVGEVHYRNFEFENSGSRDVVVDAATSPWALFA